MEKTIEELRREIEEDQKVIDRLKEEIGNDRNKVTALEKKLERAKKEERSGIGSIFLLLGSILWISGFVSVIAGYCGGFPKHLLLWIMIPIGFGIYSVGLLIEKGGAIRRNTMEMWKRPWEHEAFYNWMLWMGSLFLCLSVTIYETMGNNLFSMLSLSVSVILIGGWCIGRILRRAGSSNK